ncbi:hypothetical protein C8R44DRAFT_859576 [Mycena epipterygia]|nr:hypothetical protein C8R44DRAFT_859576 [Mycena epipterygia]
MAFHARLRKRRIDCVYLAGTAFFEKRPNDYSTRPFFLLSTTATGARMSFALNGTHIDGGTFNNVAGNMTQVFNSHVSHARISAGPERGQGMHTFIPSTTGSIGAIRAHRRSRHRNGEPYDVADRRDRHGDHQLELPHSNSNSTSAYDAHASRATIAHAPAQDDTIAVYSPNNWITSAFNSTQFQERNLVYDSAVANESDSFGRGWSNLSRDQHPMPTPVQYDPVPAYSGNEENVSADESRARPVQQSMLPYQLPPTFSETIPNTYNSVGGDMTQLTVTSYGESGIDILYQYVVMEALHNSGERFPEPACHPGTRTELLEQLRSWSTDTNPDSTILWLHGSAGLGKSAIAQMFAEECHKQRRLGGSFLFRRGHPKRGTWHGLITTIVYQLAKSVAEFLLPLQQAMEADKLVVGRAIPVQFQHLLVEPFRHIPVPRIVPVIVLDGLDECADHTIQQQILQLFIGAIRDHQLPIRLLVISRPEPHLREVLERNKALTICRPLVLSADQSAYHDIRTYLRDKFSRIYRDYTARGINLGAVWPTPDALGHLVKKSSGIFIYATTVIRFVGDEDSHPEDRLASVLRLDPLSTAPLDDLYTQILAVLPQERKQLRILHAIWQSTIPDAFHPDPEVIDILLELRPGTCRLVLSGLHSLFHVPPIPTRFSLQKSIHFLHASLPDYLGNPRRSELWEFASSEWVKGFYHNAVVALPMILSNTPPSDYLIRLMRHKEFQHSIFYQNPLFCREMSAPWPQRNSRYPSDLIQLWEGHQCIFNLIPHLELSTNRSTPTFRFDTIYAEIFSNHPNLCFVVQTMIHLPLHPSETFRILGSTWNYELFLPFYEYRELLELPFPDGDSPLDFLSDYRRAGHIYLDPRNPAEELVLLWIHRARELLMSGGLFWNSGILIVGHTHRWPRSPRIVFELESLDLSGLCDQMAVDRETHKYAHRHGILSSTIYCVLDWLRDFPDPPLRAIAIWETQIEAIKRCPMCGEWELGSGEGGIK